MLTQKLIDEFKQIFKKEYGVALNNKDAYEAATNLVNYFELLIKMDYEQKQKGKTTNKSGNIKERRMENAIPSKLDDR